MRNPMPPHFPYSTKRSLHTHSPPSCDCQEHHPNRFHGKSFLCIPSPSKVTATRTFLPLPVGVMVLHSWSKARPASALRCPALSHRHYRALSWGSDELLDVRGEPPHSGPCDDHHLARERIANTLALSPSKPLPLSTPMSNYIATEHELDPHGSCLRHLLRSNFRFRHNLYPMAKPQTMATVSWLRFRGPFTIKSLHSVVHSPNPFRIMARLWDIPGSVPITDCSGLSLAVRLASCSPTPLEEE
ncbi:hypothetical protein DM02DRAFT_386494 [Periconia macrospinosa]|uniref:Uncharacterized protein n=1 Tax=Periconia macrospinosa TaxID=97972 RepID=A0A2V1DS67_9PLEO|nr:hypothetical protein DM02DRAFT_386494 [Periconia macrospinosa]